jgi:hypothetical protein
LSVAAGALGKVTANSNLGNAEAFGQTFSGSGAQLPCIRIQANMYVREIVRKCSRTGFSKRKREKQGRIGWKGGAEDDESSGV